MNFQPAPQQWPGQEVVDGAQCFEAPQQPSHEAPIHHQQQQQAQASHAQDQEGSGSDGDDDDGDDDDFDPELATWLARTLQRRQPGAELTVGSVKVLSRLLDELTARVLAEAQRVSTTGGGGADASGSDVVAVVAAAAQAAPAPQSAQGQEQHQETQQQQQTLTSRDISKALKRVLPGEPATNKLRPYLPAVTKQAWHLDKQSLKGGNKRQKQDGVAAAAAAGAEGGGAASSKENEQRQRQQLAAGQAVLAQL